MTLGESLENVAILAFVFASQYLGWSAWWVLLLLLCNHGSLTKRYR